jgi:hypothetical protein
MDPETTWREMAELFGSGQLNDAKQKARDLQKWLDVQGFPPTITDVPAFNRLVARAACTAVLER